MTIKEHTMKVRPSVLVRRRSGTYLLGLLGLALAAALLVLATSARPATAAFGFDVFTSPVEQVGGGVETQAGARPYQMRVSFDVNEGVDPQFGNPIPDGGLIRDVVVDLPAGVVGDPTSVGACTQVQLLSLPLGCPVDSQIGYVVLYFAPGFDPVSSQTFPVFNMAPAPGQVAKLGFNTQAGTPINLIASLRNETDYGIRTTLKDISTALPVLKAHMTLWGVPSDPSHDALRDPGWGCIGDLDVAPLFCFGGGRSVPAGKAYLTNGTHCGDPLTTSLSAVAWNGAQASTQYTSASGMTGCDKLHFEPTISVKPDSTQADAPSGLTVDIEVPQNANVNGLATPSLRDAVVTLPEGMVLNPPEADGLRGCTDDEIGIRSAAAVACRPSTKIGDISIDTPVLAEQLTGSIYLGQPVPGKRFRIFLHAQSVERGVSIKLEGVLQLDPVTGKITTTFVNNPQLPFDKLHLHFKGGPRAPLATPQTCGTYTATADFTPWADPNAAPVTVQDSFTISADGRGGACSAPGFAPGFEAGLTNASAGEFSPFTMTLTRADYEQNLRSIAMSMPRGLLARIADVPALCANGQAAAGTCDEGSRIGSVTTGVGAGALPFFLPGRVYITEPYNGGPFGLSIVVPAVAGPFDLGTVVVRAAIHIDRETTALRIVSDPLPQIVEGVPLRMRAINVTIDRPRFMFAPTNCEASSIDGTIGSTAGTEKAVSSRFQVSNCARLPFDPSMRIRVGGRGRTQRGRSTTLAATVAMTPGQANLRGVKVRLPTTLNARLPVINEACTRAEFEANDCAAAKAGTATAVTPLLRDPLRGDVFFVRNGRPLPDMMVRLLGQVDVDLTGKITIPRSKYLSTNFDMVPDVPITKFTLKLVSGRQGPIGNAANLCTRRSRRARMNLVLTGQNGAVVRRSQRLGIRGCRRVARARRATGGKAGTR
jgi:hypothetical protein